MEHLEEKETGRIEAFSDGVFAIAITLLVLDLKVPHADALRDGRLLAALLAQWPGFAAFLTSFATILVMWVNHHRLFSMVKRSDHAFLFWNGLLLLFVTFVPFPTALLAGYLMHPQSGVAAAVFSGTYVLIAIAYNGMWWHASSDRRLIGRQVRAEEIEAITRQYRVGPIFYLVAFAFSFVWPPVTIAICMGLALFFAFQPQAARG